LSRGQSEHQILVCQYTFIESWSLQFDCLPYITSAVSHLWVPISMA